MKKHLLLFTLLSLIAFTKMGWGATITTTGSGNWSSTTPDAPWPSGTVPSAGDVVTIAVGHTVTLDQNVSGISITVDGTLSSSTYVISGAVSFTLGATGTLQLFGGVDGAVTVSGTKTFTDGASYEFWNTPTTTPFSSSVVSVVATNITNNIWVTLNKDVSVSGTVTLGSPLILGTNNLTLQSSATVVGYWFSLGTNNRVIDASGSGELRKAFSTTESFTFPVGKTFYPSATFYYLPVTANFTSGTFSSAYVGVKFIDSKHPNNTSATNFINRYWTITQSGISSFSCDVTATYVTADIAGTEASIYSGAYNGSAWTLYGATNTVSHQLTATAVTSFPKDFTGGETSALPVELTSFSAALNNSAVELNWATATEVNNYGFEIQRLAVSNQLLANSQELNANGWSKIGFVQGNGNSNSPKVYSFTDQPTGSKSFSYRLKQIDFDGAFEYSDVLIVNLITPNQNELLQNSPNPFNPSTTIKFYLAANSDVNIKIYDVLGKEVATLINQNSQAGYHIVYWNGKNVNGNNVASGTYLYTLTAGDFTITKKMLLMK